MKISVKNMNNNENIIIDGSQIKAWNEDYQSNYSSNLKETLKISIELNGIFNPIHLVKKLDQWYCVDGLTRLNVATELESENKWTHGEIPAIEVALDNVEEAYAACAFQKKFLSSSQRAIFGAKWYYADVAAIAAWNKILSRNGIKVPENLKTSEVVARRVAINTPDHIAKAHDLLEVYPDFYDLIYRQGYEISNANIKELVTLSKSEESREKAYAIVEEIKNIAKNNSPDKVTSIYKKAVAKVTKNYDEDDESYETKISKKSMLIGIVLKEQLDDIMLAALTNSLKHCKLEPIIINNADEFVNFQNR